MIIPDGMLSPTWRLSPSSHRFRTGVLAVGLSRAARWCTRLQVCNKEARRDIGVKHSGASLLGLGL
jgi:hypothetical protein